MSHRKSNNTGLPTNVYVVKGNYVLRPYLGRKDGKPKFGKQVKIAAVSTSIAKVWAIYESEMEKLALPEPSAPLDPGSVRTVNDIWRRFLRSEHFKNLAKRTRTAYRRQSCMMCEVELHDGSTFGESPLEAINKRVLRSYLDAYPAKVQANRHVRALSSAWSWMENRAEIPPNPCIRLEYNKETPRTRLVSEDEYQAVYGRANALLKVAMELAYLCRGRMGELENLRWENVSESQLLLVRSKGSNAQYIEMSDRLKRALQSAETLRNERCPDSPYVLTSYISKGKLSENSLSRLFAKCCRETLAAGEIESLFTFHDIKAMGATDFDAFGFGSRMDAGGWKTESMANRYLRGGPKSVPATA